MFSRPFEPHYKWSIVSILEVRVWAFSRFPQGLAVRAKRCGWTDGASRLGFVVCLVSILRAGMVRKKRDFFVQNSRLGAQKGSFGAEYGAKSGVFRYRFANR
jgi:hypothetical protein